MPKSKIKFTYLDIKTAVSKPTLKKAVELFEKGQIKNLEYDIRFVSAEVKGSSGYYNTVLSYKDIFNSDCNCYAGLEGNICKHTLALALKVLHDAGIEEKEFKSDKLKEVKKQVTKAMRKIRPYTGPSKIWFKYQRNLELASVMIADAISNLEANEENIKYLWSLVMKLSDKLAFGSVDDSDGFIGGAIYAIAIKIASLVEENEELYPIAEEFTKDDTGFDFEGDLRRELEKIRKKASN